VPRYNRHTAYARLWF